MALRRSIVFLILIGACFLLAPQRSVNGDDWLPIDPADLKMTSEPLAPSAPAIYLYRQVDRDDSGKVTTERDYVRIKILTEEGRKYANVEIPFDKTNFRVSTIRARTIRPDGSIINFDGKTYENTIVKSKSSKYLAKTFSLSEATVGSIVEYKYTLDFDDMHIFNSRWILSEELFTKKAQFSLKPYSQYTWNVSWIAPAGLPQGTEQAKEGPDRVIRMVSNNIPAFQSEEYMPPENELKFRVDFIYRDYIPEKNIDRFWISFGKKQSDNAENFVDKHWAMEAAVSQIVSPTDLPDVKLKKIYARTQQLKNLSVQNEKTAQETKREKLKSASNVEDVWKSGYGTGWNITWLFLGLARAAGFEAYPCLVSSRSEYFFQKERQNTSELNRNVVMVKLDGKELYFDPGAQFTPFGMLPWSETGVVGLRLDKEGGKWIQTNILESTLSRVERSGKLNLTENGSLEGKLTLRYTGLEASFCRVEMNNEDEASRKKYLEDQIKESIPVGIEVELSNKPNWNTSEEDLVAEFDLKVQGWASGAGRNVLVPASLFGGQEKHLFEHATRVYPVYFFFPYKKIDDLEISLPLEWKVSNVPKPFDQDLKAAEYKISVEDKGTKLHVQRELRIDLTIVPKDKYSALRGFYQIVRTQDDQQIVLQPGRTSASH